jgi:hypothetical protein
MNVLANVRIFWPWQNYVTGKTTKWNNEKVSNLYSSHGIITVGNVWWTMHRSGGGRRINLENKMVKQNNFTRIVITYVWRMDWFNLSICLLGTFTLSKHTTPLRKLFAFSGKVLQPKTETGNPETLCDVCCNKRKRPNKYNWQKLRETIVNNFNDSFKFNLLAFVTKFLLSWENDLRINWISINGA